MENQIKSISDVLVGQIQKIDLQRINIVRDIPAIITALENGLFDLKRIVSNYKFPSKEDEIAFFKKTKPNLYSTLIFLHKVYSIELNFPIANSLVIKGYLEKELEQITTFSAEDIEFIKYYRSEQTFLDEFYFVRESHKTKRNYEILYFERDLSFSTYFDSIIANILANESLVIYLNNRILNPRHGIENKTLTDNQTDEKWTDKKVALVELIYAIHSAGSVNLGNIELKALAELFEKVFNIDLSDIYHIYLEIKARKMERTIYLKRLITALSKRMDDADSK